MDVVAQLDLTGGGDGAFEDRDLRPVLRRPSQGVLDLAHDPDPRTHGVVDPPRGHAGGERVRVLDHDLGGGGDRLRSLGHDAPGHG